MKQQFSTLQVLPNELPTKVQLFKAGENKSSKGSVFYNPENKDIILKNQLMQDGRDLYPIDIDHERGASLGWFKLTVDDTGVYADEIEWTEKGKSYLANREFRYYSPTFFTDDKSNIIQIDCFALTNSPALYNLQPLVASKEIEIMSEEEQEKVALSKDEDGQEEKEEIEVELADEEAVIEEPVDEKDVMIADLQGQVAELQSKLGEAMAKLDEINAAAVEAEKEQVLSSLQLSSDKEKAFFAKMDLSTLKEYSDIVSSKKLVKEEVQQIQEEEQVEEIAIEPKKFTSAKKPAHSVVASTSAKSNIPSLEQIKARAAQIAKSR